MKKLVTVAISDDKDKFEYYESEENLFMAIKALVSIWYNGHGSINVTKNK